MELEFYMSQVKAAFVCFTIHKVPHRGSKKDSNGARVLYVPGYSCILLCTIYKTKNIVITLVGKRELVLCFASFCG